MPGYLAVKALPIFPTSAVSKCAVYQVTSPSAFALAARSANSSSARDGAGVARVANEENADIGHSNFMSALHALGLGRVLDRHGILCLDARLRVAGLRALYRSRCDESVDFGGIVAV